MNNTTCYNVNQINQLEMLLKQLKSQQYEEKRIEARKEIQTMQHIRSHLERLNTLYPDTNFDLKWRDRVCKRIGLSQDNLRWQLCKHRANNFVGKYSASFYEAIQYTKNHPEYMEIAIDVICQLNDEYGIKENIYYENQMIYEELQKFNISILINSSTEKFKDWYRDILLDFEKMFDLSNAKDSYYKETGESIFLRALRHYLSSYRPRLYGDKFTECVDQFNLMQNCTVEDLFSSFKTTPRGIPTRLLREYMVIVARDCLVI